MPHAKARGPRGLALSLLGTRPKPHRGDWIRERRGPLALAVSFEAGTLLHCLTQFPKHDLVKVAKSALAAKKEIAEKATLIQKLVDSCGNAAQPGGGALQDKLRIYTDARELDAITTRDEMQCLLDNGFSVVKDLPCNARKLADRICFDLVAEWPVAFACVISGGAVGAGAVLHRVHVGSCCPSSKLVPLHPRFPLALFLW
eukprot:1280707-Pyramimonas_sp.AAC.1